MIREYMGILYFLLNFSENLKLLKINLLIKKKLRKMYYFQSWTKNKK